MSFDEKPLKLISLIIIIDTVDGFVNMIVGKDRVKFFWEKSSAGIDGLKLGAGFEQDC